MRAALYLRVSTTDQTTENQERELRAAADRLGHTIVEVYRDHGISGGKGREKRPAFDKLHRDATLRKFDLVMAWSVDRLGRSLQDLVHFLDHLRSTRVELFLHQQGLDTTSPAGRAMFGMLSVFSEFERAIIQERIAAGMARAKAKGTKSGKPIGRPRIAAPIKDRIPRGTSRWRCQFARFGCAVSCWTGDCASRLVWRRLRPTSPCELGGSGA